MFRRINRREFLKSGALAAVLIGSSSLRALAFDQKPLERKRSRKKVIIVGAGLAGLSAAYELTQAGHDVTVLEAQMRPGGRVYTLRAPFADGLYAEAGATFVSNAHDFTLKYLKLFDVPLNPSLRIFGPSERWALNPIWECQNVIRKDTSTLRTCG